MMKFDLTDKWVRIIVSILGTAFLSYLFWVSLSVWGGQCVGFAHGSSNCGVGQILLWEAKALLLRLILFYPISGSIFAFVFLILNVIYKPKED